MHVELRPWVHFDREEARLVEDARLALYTCQSRGPHLLNKWDGYLGRWSHRMAASEVEVEGTARALRFELEHWESYLADRRATWAEHPDYVTYFGFRDSQPEHYEAVVGKLRAAIAMVESAMALVRDRMDAVTVASVPNREV